MSLSDSISVKRRTTVLVAMQVIDDAFKVVLMLSVNWSCFPCDE